MAELFSVGDATAKSYVNKHGMALPANLCYAEMYTFK